MPVHSDCLSLSYKNPKELNNIIDKDLPGQPKFKHEQIIITGKAFDVFYRDIIECIKVLYSDPDFADFLVFAPEHHYADEDQTMQLFHDMHTSQWWWDTQKVLDQWHPGATIIPIIILSDQTQTAGIDGLVMSSGDGIQCHCHPLFMCFAGDYPEQLLATGVKAMECLKCDIPTEELRSNTAPFKICNLHTVLDALARIDDGDLVFVQACCDTGIKPVIHPYWEDLPYTNIFQLYQGLIKHLLGWLAQACASHLSGTEHSQICQFILDIINIQLPGNLASSHLLKVVCGLLDFLYLAQYLCHSSKTLLLLDRAHALFHNNKEIFVDLGIQNNFNLLKLHSGRHYSTMIQTFGMTDNHNMEYTEQLHIDLAKDAYHAINHKDEFMLMTNWLEWKEKIAHHEQFIKWCLDGDYAPHCLRPPDLHFDYTQQLMRHPSIKAIPIQKLITNYGATYF
ncbi:hypothetical protein EDB19DRAFT_1831279 [Suillus lakei]|nr:hypothetical protein EDB19DRAFT_1831279 [Suillus lakei]